MTTFCICLAGFFP